MRSVVAFAAGFLMAACGPTPRAAAPNPTRDDAAAVRAFEASEDEILRDLSTIDRRIARRARILPSEDDLRRAMLSSLFADDSSLGMLDGTIDPFSFTGRGRGLSAIKAKLDKIPANLPTSFEGVTPEPAFERELLFRLVAAETIRLEEERALPRSSSSLVRAVVETWDAPKSPEEQGNRDRLLARRLAELRQSLPTRDAKSSFDGVRARELDDALDALERLVSVGFIQTTTELVALRDVLEAQGGRSSRDAGSSWEGLQPSLHAHLGIATTAAELDARLAKAQARARALAERALAATRLDRDAVALQLERLVLATEPCVDPVPGSRVRSIAAPPERRSGCHLRHALAVRSEEGSSAVALAAMHDHVVVARWTVATASSSEGLENAIAKHHLLRPPSPDYRAHLERLTLARPVAAIGGGLAAAILLEGEGPEARARAWSVLGDVPLDIATARLGARAARP